MRARRGGRAASRCRPGSRTAPSRVVADGRPFEVTTFRRDVETFGRHAVVAFSDRHRRGRRAPRLHHERALRPARRHGGRPARRPARPARRPGALRRRPGARGSPRTTCASCASSASTPGTATRPAASTPTASPPAPPLQDGPRPALARARRRRDRPSSSPRPTRRPRSPRWPPTGILARVLPGADPRAAGAARPPRGRGRRSRRAGSAGSPRSAGARTGPRRCASRAPTPARSRRSPRRWPPASRPAAAAYRHGAEAARDAALIRAARARRAAAARPRGRDRPRRRRASSRCAPPTSTCEGPALGAALKRLEAAWIASDFALDADRLRARSRPGPADG